MSVFRVGGISSGLDTEGMIKQLMQIERRPVVLMEQRQATMVTEANAWRDLNNRLLNLKNRLNDLRNLAGSIWNGRSVAVADAKVLTAQANSTAELGSHTVQVTTLARGTTLKSGLSVGDPTTALGISGTIEVSGGPGNTKTIDIQAGHTLNNIAAEINGRKAELGFSASVLQVNPGDYRLVLTGQTGAANNFSLIDVGPDSAATDLKLTNALADQKILANNAEIEVNGIQIFSASNEVKDAIPGVTLRLAQVGTTTVAVARDTQRATEAVKAFVDQYNSVVDFMDSLTKYDPKTKVGGTLLGESTVQMLRGAISNRLNDPVATLPVDVNAMSMIGIGTERFTQGGVPSAKLKFDQTKFLAALEKDPDSVQKLFTLNENGNQGVATRLNELLDSYTRFGGVILNKARSLETSAQQTKERIDHMDTQIMPRREKRLRDQFIALEKALAVFQNQGTWLTAQLANLAPTKQK